MSTGEQGDGPGGDHPSERPDTTQGPEFSALGPDWAERRRRRVIERERRARRRKLRIAAGLIAAAAAVALAVSLTGGGGGRRNGARSSGRAYASTSGSSRARAHARAGTPKKQSASPPAGTEAAEREGDPEALESPQVKRLIALGKPIYCGGPKGDEVALTFDDGPGQYTWLAIPKLRKHGIKATFFIVGRNIDLRPQALREERALGAVGDHTYTHPLLTSLGPGEAEDEIVRTQAAVERTSGGPVFLFRPPYGALDPAIEGIARAHNLLPIMWTVDTRDSLGANYAEIERNAIEGLKPGAIILMHENHGQTIRAMLGIFAAIQRKHLRTVSVPTLLTDDPPSEAQVRAGGAGCGALYKPGGGGG